MAIKTASRVKEVASNKPNAATAFNLPDSAAAGYKTFDWAFDSGDVVPYFATNGTDWESGLGTFTAGTPDTLARTTILESSSGSAIDWSAGADVTVFCEWSSRLAAAAALNYQAIIPGGRLTLQSGVPVTTTDQTAKTSVYYTPYKHNLIGLWNGINWHPIEFAETALALGTVTASLPYDVFGYLSSGALALEKLAWTNGTTRATGISLQDGRYCKTGDKTRLYLGTFYTASTTTTEDSEGGTTTNVGGKRFLWNMYNRVLRSAKVIDAANTWSYTTNAVRQANGNTGNQIEVIKGLSEDIDKATAYGIVYLLSNSSVAAKTGVGLNSTTTFSGVVQGGFYAAGGGLYAPVGGAWSGHLAAGYNYISWNERGGDGTCTFLGDNGGDGQQAGLIAEVWS